MSKSSQKKKKVKPDAKIRTVSQGGTAISLILVFLVGAAALAAFGSSVRGVFVWDDEYVVRQNLFIKSCANLRHLATGEYFAPAGKGHYTRSGEESYRPVVTLTHFIDYALFGMTPAGYHAVNVMLHVLVCIVLYFLLISLGTGRAGAAAGAALFAVHPVHSETVNMISYREDLLAGLFTVLAFYAWEKRRTAASVTFYALALLSKEMALAFLPLVAAREILRTSRSSSPRPASTRGVRKQIPPAPKKTSRTPIGRLDSAAIRMFLLLTMITVLYLIILFFAFPAAPPRQATYPGGSFVTGMATMARVLGHYMCLAVFPVHLRVDYAFPASTGLIDPAAMLSLAVAILVIAAALRAPMRHPAPFLLIWFFLALMPVSGIYPITNFIAERYLYIPLMGICGAAGTGLAILFSDRNKSLRIAGILLTGIIIGAGILQNINRNRAWRAEEKFYLEMVRSCPESYRGYSGLGVVRYRQGRLEEAEDALTRSIELKPDHTIAMHNLGNVKQGLGDQAGAVEVFRRVIELNPTFAESRYQLALIYKSRGDVKAAEEELLRVLSINSNFIPARFILGVIFQDRGDFEEAANIYESILTLDPSYGKALKNLGILHLYRFGDRQTASIYLKKYLALVPGDPQRDTILAEIDSAK